MTATETATAAPAAGPDAAIAVAAPTASGLAGLLGTGDHKPIGRLWILTSLLYLMAAGITGALVGAERLDTTDLQILEADTYGQTFSLHSIAGVFLFLLPLLIGLATYVVPLQVGASTIAFPRAAAAAYWTYLVGGAILIGAYAGDGGPFGGDDDLVSLFLAALVVVLVALTLAAVCVASTALALRAPGMTLRRTPLFSWASIVTAAVWVLTLPVLAGVLVLVYVDHRYGQVYLGGSEGIHGRLAWIWAQPTLYALAIPALGIVGDIVPVAARTRLTQHRVAMTVIGAFGVLSIGAWAMPGFTPDNVTPSIDVFVNEPTYVAFAFLVLLPLLGLAGLIADTLRRGAVRVTGGLAFSVAALLMLLAGAANGALVSINELELHRTAAQTAQTHYVVAAAVLAAFGGLTFWAPKLWGASMPDGAGVLLAVAGLLGTVLLSLPDVIVGFLDAADDADTIDALSAVSLAGGVLLGVAALAFVGLLIKTAATGSGTDDDPVDGHTLEWATSSPPPVGNFAALPAITSEAPVYDARHAQEGDA